VPSVVTAGRDSNVVVNPAHPDAARILVGPETAAAIDRRPFGGWRGGRRGRAANAVFTPPAAK
jgi:hypothetical protein